MALPPDPVGAARFRVEIDGIAASGFSEVVFPEFAVAAEAPPAPLLLRRAATGALDLYKWWDEARRQGRGATRDLAVELIGAEGQPVLRWRFSKARPLSLTFSPLDAGRSALLIETLAVGFERVEMG